MKFGRERNAESKPIEWMDYNEVTETKIRKLLDIAISGEREWQFEHKKNHIQIATNRNELWKNAQHFAMNANIIESAECANAIMLM